VRARRGFGDETWRLARAGDAEALQRAGDLLLAEPLDLAYEGHRARAFALAVEGDAAGALHVLNAGWTDEWPFPAAYALDVARVRYLVGDYEHALDAIRLALRGAERVDGSTAELAKSCVRHRRSLWPKALASVTAGGSVWIRVAGAAAVLRATVSPGS
jgi:hypothetical protein